MEIDFYNKVNHIEYLRKLIRMKRLNLSRKKLQYKPEIARPSVVLIPSQFVLEGSNAKVIPKVPASKKLINRPAKPKPVLDQRKTALKLPEIVSKLDDRRDEWLYKRQSSTVQLFPTINGRERDRH